MIIKKNKKSVAKDIIARFIEHMEMNQYDLIARKV